MLIYILARQVSLARPKIDHANYISEGPINTVAG